MNMARLTAALLTFAAILPAANLSFAQSTKPQTTKLAVEPTTAPTNDKTAIIVVRGVIDEFTRDGIFRRFDEARAAGAKTVILQLDTPGGLVVAGLDISRYLRNITDL